MRKIFLIVFLFFLALPGPERADADSWLLKEAPRDRAVESILHTWIDVNRHDFCYGFDDEQAALLKRLVSGGLVWAYSNGNRFAPNEFLALFSDRNQEDLTWCVFPSGGMLFVLRSSYVRISFDDQEYYNLPPHLRKAFPQGGRWFLAFGSGNLSHLFYFQNLTPSSEPPLALLP